RVGCESSAERLTWASTLGTRALSPRLSAHGPVVRLAGAPRAERHLEGRGDLGLSAGGSVLRGRHDGTQFSAHPRTVNKGSTRRSASGHPTALCKDIPGA